MKDEIWKPILNYEGLYEISNLGRVKSLPKSWIAGEGVLRSHNGKILKQSYSNINRTGYLQVVLYKDSVKVKYKVHRLVALSFLGNPPQEDSQVDHINGIKTDNKVSNLRWVSRYENTMCNPNTPTTPEKSIAQYSLDNTLIKVYKSISEAVRFTGIDQASITRCCQGKFKHAKNYIWRYHG